MSRTKSRRDGGWALELALDGFHHVLVVHQADDCLHLLAVAGDQHAGGKADDPATRLSQGIVAQQNRIVHGRWLSIDFEALFFHPSLDTLLASVLHGLAYHGEAARAVLLLELDTRRN